MKESGSRKRGSSMPEVAAWTEAPEADDEDALPESGKNEEQIVRRVYWGLLPFLMPMALFTYLDRSALSFAAPALIKFLHLSPSQYATGAGLVFVGYVIFNIPSSLVTHRLGAPLWLGFLLLAWGAVCACTSLVTTQAQFYLLRLLLGIAEAGCFPGAWFHLSLFLNEAELAFAYACVLAAAALAQVVGGPLAAALLRLEGHAGLHGWQWLFLVEGGATCLYGLVFAAFLPKSPRTAWCLSAPDRAWLRRRQEAEKARMERKGPVAGTALGALLDWRPWYIGLSMFLVQCGNIGILYFMPLMLKAALYKGSASADPHGPEVGSLGGGSGEAADNLTSRREADRDSRIALISTALFSVTVISQVCVGYSSKRFRERRWHITVPLVVGGAAFLLTQPAFSRGGFLPGYLMLIVAAGGVVAYNGPVGALPAAFLHGPARPAGVAVINSITALGGFVGPWLVGELARGENYAAALGALGALVLAAAGLLCFFPDRAPAPAPEEEAGAAAAVAH